MTDEESPRRPYALVFMVTDDDLDEDYYLQVGREFAARLAKSLTVQPIRWAYLDNVLIDWWYESVEQYRATDDGMPEQRPCI